MKTCSIIRFKPKEDYYEAFVEARKVRSEALIEHPNRVSEYTLLAGDEVVSVTIFNDVDYVIKMQDMALEWLDQHRYMLEEYSSADRHTIAITGLVDAEVHNSSSISR